MSKLIDKLNQAPKATPQPMGFRINHPASAKPRPILIASLSQVINVTGTDAVLFTKLSAESRTLPKINRSFSDIPWGIWLSNISKRGIKPLAEAGCDFAVFPPGTALSETTGYDKLGKILQLDATLDEGLLRTVNELAVDAVLVSGEKGEEQPLTWHRLMLFQRFSSLLTKPLLVSIPLDTDTDELQAIWKTGVDGMMVEIEAGQPVGMLEELHRKIEKSDFPERKHGKVEALLPRLTEEPDTVIEEEE